LQLERIRGLPINKVLETVAPENATPYDVYLLLKENTTLPPVTQKEQLEIDESKKGSPKAKKKEFKQQIENTNGKKNLTSEELLQLRFLKDDFIAFKEELKNGDFQKEYNELKNDLNVLHQDKDHIEEMRIFFNKYKIITDKYPQSFSFSFMAGVDRFGLETFITEQELKDIGKDTKTILDNFEDIKLFMKKVNVYSTVGELLIELDDTVKLIENICITNNNDLEACQKAYFKFEARLKELREDKKKNFNSYLIDFFDADKQDKLADAAALQLTKEYEKDKKRMTLESFTKKWHKYVNPFQNNRERHLKLKKAEWTKRITEILLELSAKDVEIKEKQERIEEKLIEKQKQKQATLTETNKDILNTNINE